MNRKFIIKNSFWISFNLDNTDNCVQINDDYIRNIIEDEDVTSMREIDGKRVDIQFLNHENVIVEDGLCSIKHAKGITSFFASKELPQQKVNLLPSSI